MILDEGRIDVLKIIESDIVTGGDGNMNLCI